MRTRHDEETLAPLRHLSAVRIEGHERATRTDTLVVEEPLEIRLQGRRFSATMRTPGNDDLLALGLLLSEGFIHAADEVESITCTTRCRENSQELVHLVDVELFELPAGEYPERGIIANSSCGLCGKATIERLLEAEAKIDCPGAITRECLLQLPLKLRHHQELFNASGGLHAAAIFSAGGEMLACFEDIGRHNAVDKCLGFGLQAGWLPWGDTAACVLLVSGRLSFEIVQKAVRAHIPVVSAVSAASSLAIDLAAACGLTAVAFLRDKSFTVYNGAERIV